MTDPTATTRTELLAAIERVAADAQEALREACQTGRLRMAIPARPGYDHDLRIGAALSLLTRAAAEIRALETTLGSWKMAHHYGPDDIDEFHNMKAELAALRDAFAPVDVYFMDPPDGGIVTFAEQLARLVADWQALRQDRERLDWLEECGVYISLDGRQPHLVNPIGTTRAAIDAARQAGQPEGEQR